MEAGTGSGPGPASGAAPAGGERRITISDVAARAGVSKSAVSFVFNGRSGLSAGTTDRIVRAARDLGWRPSRRARALSGRELRSAGLVLSDRDAEGGPELVGFLRGAGAALAELDAILVVRVVATAGEELEVHRVFVREGQVDVVLITGLRLDDERPAALAALGLPFVIADEVAASGESSDGTREAVRHLSVLGHRRIALVGSDSLVRSVRRLTGFAQEARMLGLDAEVQRLPDLSPASAGAATARLLGRTGAPTALVYETALHAAAGLDAAGRCGLRVPADVSIVALEDGPVALATAPALTAARRDSEAWGRACGWLLAGRAGDGAPPLPPAELVVRGSTAPPPRPLEHGGPR